MADLKVAASVINGNEEGNFLGLIIETLDQIAKNDEDINIDDIKENVIFVFHNDPAITKGTDSCSVIASFNLPKLKENIKNDGLEFNKRAKDIIAHEIAHYVSKNWNKAPAVADKEADDLIEKWGFNRAYKV
jgi:hypothetical protein